MKIINRTAFLALPAGTVFSKYRPCIFGELLIKGDTINENDFYHQQIADAVKTAPGIDFSDLLLAAQENGNSIAMDFNCQGRDGLYDEDQLFAVWEEYDVSQLAYRLLDSIGDVLCATETEFSNQPSM